MRKKFLLIFLGLFIVLNVSACVNSERNKALDMGVALTPKFKEKSTSALFGKSFAFNGKEFTKADVYRPNGEFFLHLNSDKTFVLVHNDSFKEREAPEESSSDLASIMLFSGKCEVSEDEIELVVDDFCEVRNSAGTNKRINNFKIDFNSITISKGAYDKLPSKIESKIEQGIVSSEGFSNSYLIKKEGNYWRFGLYTKNKNFRKEGFLHKYDHVYPIPNSINEFIEDKVKKGEVVE